MFSQGYASENNAGVDSEAACRNIKLGSIRGKSLTLVGSIVETLSGSMLMKLHPFSMNQYCCAACTHLYAVLGSGARGSVGVELCVVYMHGVGMCMMYVWPFQNKFSRIGCITH